jgi:hypothetical protein
VDVREQGFDGVALLRGDAIQAAHKRSPKVRSASANR